jgi:predicted DNA-binding transcriptional regulator YafY
VLVGYFEAARMLAAWCEMRQDFRHFRTDRIVTAHFLDERHGQRPSELKRRWKRQLMQRSG